MYVILMMMIIITNLEVRVLRAASLVRGHEVHVTAVTVALDCHFLLQTVAEDVLVQRPGEQVFADQHGHGVDEALEAVLPEHEHLGLQVSQPLLLPVCVCVRV